jgi:hypothetical protein
MRPSTAAWGGMVLYAVFATDRLGPEDRSLLVEGLQNSPASMHQPTVEAAIAAAGFQVVQRERIASEWSEYQLEHDPGYLTQDLLELARLTRNRHQAEAVLGRVWYERALAFAAWRLQIVLGGLLPVLYAPGQEPGGCADTGEPEDDLAIIRKLRPRMGSTRFVFWTVKGSALPTTWDEAVDRLMSSSATPGPGAP